MNVTDIFSQKIYEVSFPNYDEIKDSLINYVSNSLPNKFINEYDGHEHPIRNGALTVVYDRFADMNATIDHPILKQIHDFINEHGRKYWEILNFSKLLNPYILQLWINAVPKGGFVASHNHNPTPISGVFYINAEPRMGNLFLENPLEILLGRTPMNSEGGKPFRNFDYEVQSTSGKLVLFPGWMKHYTKINSTDECRMSMAVNFGCYGEVYFTEFI